MPRGLVMGGGVMVRRSVTATDMAARQAEPEMEPLVSGAQAVLATSPGGRHIPGHGEMAANRVIGPESFSHARQSHQGGAATDGPYSTTAALS